jgi:hypothetical protein
VFLHCSETWKFVENSRKTISKKFSQFLDQLFAHVKLHQQPLFHHQALCIVQPGSVCYIFNIGANTKTLMKIRTPTIAASLRKTSERAHAYANIYQIAACIVAKPLQHGTANHSLFGPVRAAPIRSRTRRTPLAQIWSTHHQQQFK